jgi:MerR family copper efflux transcriptional regulator
VLKHSGATAPLIADKINKARLQKTGIERFVGTLERSLESLDQLPDRTARCDPGCNFLSAPNVDRAPPPALMLWDLADHQPPAVACTLTGPEQVGRAAAWNRVLRTARRSVVPNGLRLSLPPDVAGNLAALTGAEKQCCPHTTFSCTLTLAKSAST